MEKKNNAWIKSLYQRSWEMELLISGFTLIILMQSISHFSNVMSWVDYYVADRGVFYLACIFVVSLLALSTIVLTVFLILNLAFRAYWIALIGLMSRTKKNHGKFLFSHNKKQNILQVKDFRATYKHMDQVDKWGSQLFSIALLFVFLVASIVLLCIEYIAIIEFIRFIEVKVFTLLHHVIALLFGLTGLIFIIDIFSGGFISRIPVTWVSNIYFYIYRIFRVLSGYFLYEKVALSGKGNGQVKAINITLLLVVLWIALIEGKKVDMFDFDKPVFNEGKLFKYGISYLDDIKDNGYLTAVTMDKKVYNQMPISVFIPFTATTIDYITEKCSPLINNKITIQCVSDNITLSIDNLEQNVSWHTTKYSVNKTAGVMAYIDQPSLTRGAHTLKVSLSFLDHPLTKEFWYYPK